MSMPNDAENSAEAIYRQARLLPPGLRKEVLDFIGYLESRYQESDESRAYREAQIPAMEAVWDNAEDEVWDDW
ncbi:MAG: hypothetical protein ACQERG_04740 [Pseudomonadota bacterium]